MKSKVEYRVWMVTTVMGIACLAVLLLAASAEAPAEETMGKKPMMSKTPTTMPCCPMCVMKMKHMRMMKKLEKLLTEAKIAAEAEHAEKTMAKIAEAQALLGKKCKALKEHMDRDAKKCELMKKHAGKGVRCCAMCGKVMGPCAQRMVVNDRCPMTGKKIDPTNVPAEQTRQWKGQKVGFCCTNCPMKWDKLSDKDKQAKLDAVMKPAPPTAGE